MVPPPCSSFSISGDREKSWGKNKKFREGQNIQVLDDLFFDFIETVKILQPKIVVAENVKGLTMGMAKGYVKEIAKSFDLAGYDLQIFLLNSAFMGVPQRRERIFFIAKKKSIKYPKLILNFNETPINVKQAFKGCSIGKIKKLSEISLKLWRKCSPGKSLSTVHPKGSYFNSYKLNPNNPSTTVCSGSKIYHWVEPRSISQKEVSRLQSFPDDFNTNKTSLFYVCGMSVPPFMMQRLSFQIKKQWLDLKL